MRRGRREGEEAARREDQITESERSCRKTKEV
jgi:hypothetical protein